MIQTKQPIVYGLRSEKVGVIRIEVRPQEITPIGQKFLVIDWDIANDKEAVFSKVVEWTNQEINTMDAYLEGNHDFSSLSRIEKEYKKLQMALYIDTISNLLPSGKTIYGLEPEKWMLTPDAVVEINND
jgi:hypothetical protein